MKMLLKEEHGVGRYKVESEGVVIEERATEMYRQHLELLLENIPTMFQSSTTAESCFGAAIKVHWHLVLMRV
ncbi:hypothetical protein ERO13_A10G114113v2 [Gossypium hirsutum]|uniref:Uncharacterized protein n=1 Tax=Gossypium mustelinum TaxID=34275 RepID=A0A5D2XKR6_GOSMU|nr:hypothetical protein ERO13_A10G114113v2 [Gossypium hirsutum]TYJ14584.1 hypothetical protein E1A91_A10G128000v1 [Gossypium mustelinum]TYJ14585.1 hypothetical protein E1A91_A10G128000v1 [Gossypium mustelinum]